MDLKVKHVCFDKDGTLIDVHASWVPITRRRAQKIILFYRLPEAKLHDACRAMGVDLGTQKILPGGPVGYKPRATIIASVAGWLRNLQITASDDQLAGIFREVDTDLQNSGDFNANALPGVIDGIKRLKHSGFKISVYTSDRHKNTQRVLELLGLCDDIDAVVGGDDVRCPKPDPEGFHKACHLVGVDAARSVYVGDTVDDMLMAKRSGSAGGYGIAHGLATREELAVDAINVFDAFTALIDSLIELKDGKKTTPSV
jgi:phosphoglycolate phosphatase-like HAD superfamily hydrolase